jgi:hypothetical protein
MWWFEQSPLFRKVHTKWQFVLKWDFSLAVFLFLWALLCKLKEEWGDNDGYSSSLIVSLFLSSE